MEGTHRRLFEISNLLQDDSEGNFLMEEVLNACFDYSMLTLDAKLEQAEDQLTKLIVVLERFNIYIAERFSLFREGLFQGGANEVALWSEDLTYQIMSNRPN